MKCIKEKSVNKIMRAIVVIVFAIVQGSVFGADVTWDGGGGDANWSTGGNWVGDTAPGNPLAGTMYFNTNGQSTVGIVDADWTIDVLNVNFEEGNEVNFAHTIDLGGNKLTINNELSILNAIPVGSGGEVTVTFTNGTLQLGTSGNLANLMLGRVHQSGRTESVATLQFGAGSTLIPYLDRIELSIQHTHNHKGSGRLDLRGVAIQDDTLSVNTLRIADQGGWNSSGLFSYMALDASSNLQTLEIKSELTMGTGIRTQARLGDPDEDWKLPADLDVVLGADTSNRASVKVGCSSANRWLDAYLVASSGGTIEAYVDTFEIGRNFYDNDSLEGLKEGIVDFSAMDSCKMDVTTLIIGTDTAGIGQNPGQGTFKLPSGTLKVGSVTLGDGSNTDTFGLLELNGTATEIANSLTIGSKGTLKINVNGSYQEVDISSGVPLTIENGGLIDIYFATAGNAIRWEGDNRTAIDTFLEDGKIVWEKDENIPGTLDVYYFGGDTIVRLLPPPVGTIIFIK